MKDNIDTVGPLGTTAGSLALADTGPSADAPLVTSLRAAGALVLGKTNLSEWASIRSDHSTSGWSAVGGLCRNPHALDRSAGGSSSGSGAAVAAGYAPLAVGTETDGSIVCPSALNGLVGLKPTVGSITGAGIVPISHRQDTAGPMARSVRDAALMFSVLSGQPAVELGSVRGRRLGVPRTPLWGHHPASDAAATVALEALDAAGVVIVDDLELPALPDDKSIGRILLADLVVDLRSYLATRPDAAVASLSDVIRFNLEHADVELGHFGQDLFTLAEEWAGEDDADQRYREALDRCMTAAKTEGIDRLLADHRLDALAAPAYPPAWKIDLVDGDHIDGSCSGYPAIAGYPVISVPCGAVDDLPLGLGLIGDAGSEPVLLGLAAAVEAALGPAPRPTFRPARVG